MTKIQGIEIDEETDIPINIVVKNFKPGKEGALIAAIFDLDFKGKLVDTRTTSNIFDDDYYLDIYNEPEDYPEPIIFEHNGNRQVAIDKPLTIKYYPEFETFANEYFKMFPAAEIRYKMMLREEPEFRRQKDLYELLGMETD